MEKSQDDEGGSDRSSTGNGSSYDSFKSTKTSFSLDQEATSFPNVPQKDDTNTIGPVVPKKGVVRRHFRRTGKQGSTGRPGPSVEQKLNSPKSPDVVSPSTVVDSFIKKRRRDDETGPSVEPKHKSPKSFDGASSARPVVPEKGVVRRRFRRRGKQGSTARLKLHFPKSSYVVSPRPVVPEKGVVRRRFRRRGKQDSTGRPGPSVEQKHHSPKFSDVVSPSTLVDFSIKKRLRNDETEPSVEPEHKFPKSFDGVSPRIEESKDDIGGSHRGHKSNFEDSKKSVAHPVNDGVSSSFSDTKISPSTDHINPERPRGHESNFEDSKKSVAHPVNDGVSSSFSDTKISPSTDHINPERPRGHESNFEDSKKSVAHPVNDGVSSSFSDTKISPSTDHINPERPRHHALSIEDTKSPRRTSFGSSSVIVRDNTSPVIVRGETSAIIVRDVLVRDKPPPVNVRVESPPVNVSAESPLVIMRHGPPPVISWVEEFGMIVIGVYLFCATTLLSIPYALNEGGWITLSIYVVFLFATFFTADIIPLCFPDISVSRTYLDLGSLAFGLPGRSIALVSVCMFSYATCIDCVMINREHFKVLWPEENILLTIMSIVIPAMFVCFCSLNEYRPLWNGIGVFLSVIVIILIVFLGALDVGFQVKQTSVFHSSTAHLSIGFFSFCLCGHSVLPVVYSRVRNRTKYQKILIIIFAISTTLYVGTGCFGYAMFGKETKSLFTLNLPKHSFVSQLAMGITVINHMLRYILNITPLAQNLEGLLPENYRNLVWRMVIRSVLAATTALAFLGKGHYGLVVSLMGSIVGITISLIIPAVCFLAIRWNNLPRLMGWLCCSTILVGAFSMIFVIIRSSMSFP